MFYTTMVLIANDYGYKILRFWANPQKYQTLVPAKNSHLKVYNVLVTSYIHIIYILLYVCRESTFPWDKKLFNLPPLVLKARHLHVHVHMYVVLHFAGIRLPE